MRINVGRLFAIVFVVVGLCGLVSAPAPAAPPSAAPAAASTHRAFPTVEAAEANRAAKANAPVAPAAAGAALLRYGGGVHGVGVTTGPPKAYAVFWGSQWGTANPPGSTHLSGDPSGVAPRVEALLAGLGTNNELWSGVVTQYCEGVPLGTTACPASAPHVGYPTGGALAGIWVDTATPAPSAATPRQLGNEAVRAAAHFGNTTEATNRNVQYVIVSPRGTRPDGFNTGQGFCAWHDYTGSPYVGSPSDFGDLAFTNLPYLPDAGKSCGESFLNPGTPGLLDGVTIVEGHEFSETITDQFPFGGWYDGNGQENADKCIWIRSGPARVDNVTFATGTFAMQTTWSNDGEACLMAHAIWGQPGSPDEFSAELRPKAAFVTPGQSASTTVKLLTVSGNPQAVDLSVTGVPPDSTYEFSSSSVSSDDAPVLTVHTSATTPLATYRITITATGAVTTHQVAYTLTVGGPPQALTNFVTLTNLSGSADSQHIWKLDVPSNGALVSFSLFGGSGDADLYVRKDAIPTLDDNDCASRRADNLDACQRVYGEKSGTWYVMVHGSSNYSAVSLTGSYITGILPALPKKTPVTLSGAAGSVQVWYWNLPGPNAVRSMKIKITRGKGDANLYVRRDFLPTSVNYDCAPQKVGKAETCSQKRPPGFSSCLVMVTGVTDYSDVKLSATYS